MFNLQGIDISEERIGAYNVSLSAILGRPITRNILVLGK